MDGNRTTHTRPQSRQFVFWVCSVLVIGAMQISQAQGTTKTWLPSVGAWETASNWNPRGVPGAGDSVVINSAGSPSMSTYTGSVADINGTGSLFISGGSLTLTGPGTSSLSSLSISGGTLTLNADMTVTSLSLSGGTITGTGTLTVAGVCNWSSGDMRGTGTTAIATGGHLNISGSADKNLLHGSATSGGHKLVNAGTVTWSGTGRILGGDGSTITNQSGGVFEAQNDSSFDYLNFGNEPSFVNQAGAIIRKTGSTGTTTFGRFSVNNTGTVDVQTGTLSFNNGSASHTMGDGSIFTGAGVSLFNGSVVTASGNITVDGTLELGGGQLFGTHTLSGSGALNWTGGSMRGTGTTTVASGFDMTISGASDKNLLHGSATSGGHNLVNAGTLTWSGTGRILGGDGSTITNQSGGVFEAQNDSSFDYVNFGNEPSFINQAGAIIRKTGSTGTTTFGRFNVNNSGTVDVQTGTLSFNNTNASHTIGDGSTFTGAGISVFSGPVVTASGTLTIDGTLEFGGGQLYGTHTLSGTGTFKWTGGSMRGTGTTTVASGFDMTVSGAADKNLLHGSATSGGHKLVNAGTVTWSGTGRILGGDGSTITNQSGGVFDIQDDSTLGDNGYGNNPAFTNQSGAVVRKSGGTGTTTIGSTVSFTTAGNLELQSGTFTDQNGFTQTGGQTILSGGNLSAGGTITIQSSLLTGAGTVTANVSNAGTVGPGGAGTSPGVLNIEGNYTQTSTGVLDVDIAGESYTTPDFDQLKVTGTATLDGTLNVSLINSFLPVNGNTFKILTFGSWTGDFSTKNGLSSGGAPLVPQYSSTDLTLVAGSGPTSFDAVADFSIASNPNGAWSYGYSATRGAAFNLDTLSQSQTNLDIWSGTSSGPNIIKNKSGTTQNYATIVQPPDLLNLDPSFDGRNPVVRWTAPTAGTFNVSGRFQGIDVGPTTTDVAVLKNSSTTLFSADINSFNGTASFSLNVTVAAGDQIDFSVGKGLDGSSFNDSTGLAATISAATDSTPPTVLSCDAAQVGSGYGKITFSEDVRSIPAKDPANYIVSQDGVTLDLTTATFNYDATAHTVTISGDSVSVIAGHTVNVRVINVKDIAGNSIVDNGTTNVCSTVVRDEVKPTVVSCSADSTSASVTFSEAMNLTDAATIGNYIVESPLGTPVDLTGKTAVYDATTNTTTIVGLSLTFGNTFEVIVTSVKDVAGNAIPSPGANVCSGVVAIPSGAVLSLLSGDQQTGVAGQPLGSPLIVRVDAPSPSGPKPVPGVNVTFTVTQGGGSLTKTITPSTSATVATAANGQASILLTLGATAGTNTVEAAAPDITGSLVTFTETGKPGESFNLSVTADPTTVAQGGQSHLTATVIDANDNPIPDLSLLFEVIAGNGLVSGASTAKVTTDAQGVAGIDLTNISYGSNQVRVSDAGLALASRIASPVIVEVIGAYAIRLSTGYNLAGVPFVLNNPDPSAVFGQPANQVKLAGWDESANGGDGDYTIYTGSNYSIVPGRGFWVKRADDSDLGIGSGNPVDGNHEFALSMNRGWELIANPFQTDVTWDFTAIHVKQNGADIGDLNVAGVAGDAVEPYAWIWNTLSQAYHLVFDANYLADVPDSLRPTTTSVLPAGAGAFFMSNRDHLQLVLPAQVTTSASRARTAIPSRKADGQHWGAELIASAGGTSRSIASTGNIFGLLQSSQLRNGLRVFKAPQAADDGGGYVDLAFLGNNEERYAWDLRSSGADNSSLVWRFQVTTNLNNSDIQITYPNLASIPKGFRLYLIDEATGRKQALRTTTNYTFRSQPAGATLRNFRLEVTQAPGARLRIANFTASDDSRSLQPGTRMTFTVSQAATAKLTIRTATGRVVYDFPLTDLKAGINTAYWEGKTHTGAFVPRGVYLLELTAQNDLGEQVRAVRTVRVR